MWANTEPIKLGSALTCVLGATIGHADDMHLAIQHGLGLELSPGSKAGRPHRIGPAGAVSLLHRSLLRVVLGGGLEAPHTVERSRVRVLKSKLLLQELCSCHVKLV